MAGLRSLRHATALSAVAALLLAGCGGDDPTVEIEAADETSEGTTEEAPEEPEEPETEPEAPTEDEPDEADQPDETATAEGSEDRDGSAAADATAGPTPDPALVDDPCAPEQGREGDAFITVVSPVPDQVVTSDSVELVGCSNVFEANVQWSLYDGDGRELDSGFTTAECGNGCVGAFSEEISLAAAEGEPFAELHVYAEDMSGEQDRQYLTAIPLVLE
jgi:hypothetical protein